MTEGIFGRYVCASGSVLNVRNLVIETVAVTLGETALPFKTSEPVLAQQCSIRTL